MRASSRPSLQKARTTRTPVRFSSRTALILSSSFWSFRNRGEALRMIRQASSSTAQITASSSTPIQTSSRKVRAMAARQITGTGTTSCSVVVKANWMVVMSEMVRVVMEAVPNWRKS